MYQASVNANMNGGGGQGDIGNSYISGGTRRRELLRAKSGGGKGGKGWCRLVSYIRKRNLRVSTRTFGLNAPGKKVGEGKLRCYPLAKPLGKGLNKTQYKLRGLERLKSVLLRVGLQIAGR